MLEVTIGTTADLLEEIQDLKQQLQQAKTQEDLLERRLAEATGSPPEYIGRESTSCHDDMYCLGHLRLRKHPRCGMVMLYFGAVTEQHVADAHDLILWHPASGESPKQQAETVDQCLRLACTHGLNVAVVSWSSHILDRLRLRVAEHKPYNDYCEVVHYAVDHAGVTTKHRLDLLDTTCQFWPTDINTLGIDTEVAIGYEAEQQQEDNQDG